jgi:hypothetical protein
MGIVKRAVCDFCKREMPDGEKAGSIFTEDIGQWVAFAVDGAEVNNANIVDESMLLLCPVCRQVVKWDPYNVSGSRFIPIGQELTSP